MAEVVKETIQLGINVEQFIYTDEDVPYGSLDFYKVLEKSNGTAPDVQVTEDDTYIMMYTSGTTGLIFTSFIGLRNKKWGKIIILVHCNVIYTYV